MLDREEELEQKQFEMLIHGLIENEYGCCNDFINNSTVVGLKNNIDKLVALGDMQPSGFGNKDKYQQNKTIRNDKINWLADQSKDHFESIYLKKIERFIKYLNATCFTSIRSFESHYSTYAKNSFYKRHIDQFKNENARKFSIVLYLNEDWKEADYGTLSLYPQSGIQVNISPYGGRMVLFRSDKMEHEVQSSTTRTRNSIVGWLKI